MSFKRAITEEQKNERRQKILDSARSLFEQTDFKSITIEQIAQNSGIAKGSVFLYFKTKEELFLYLTIEELEKWNHEFDSKLENVGREKALQTNELLDLVDSTLIKNTVLIRLLAMLSATFEQNIGYEQAYHCKRIIYQRTENTGLLLDRYVCFFQNGDGAKFYLFLYALIAGLYQMSNPPPVVKQVLQDMKLHGCHIDFRTYLLDMLKYLLDGMERGHVG